MLSNEIDNRIIRLIDLLKYENKLSSMEEFYTKVEVSRGTLSKIRNSEGNHFTVVQIYNFCKAFGVNANFAFGLENNPFLKP